jgi:hypothetical protein
MIKTIIVLVVGFVIGVSYMNGSLNQLGDTALRLLNTGAEAVVEATEPTTLEKIEKKVVDIAQQ